MHTVLTGWVVGLMLGMRHALEPDHLTAVCTLMSERGGARRGLLLGAWWGLGHSLSLLVVGTLLAVLQARLPVQVANAFELAVAVMLIALGARAIARPFSPEVAAAVCAPSRARFAPRSLLVGVVHGLAGSGALTALVLAELPSTPSRLVYIVLFGCGSMLGMALLSGLAGWPLARFGRSRRASAALAMAAGGLSIAFGMAWGLNVLGAMYTS